MAWTGSEAELLVESHSEAEVVGGTHAPSREESVWEVVPTKELSSLQSVTVTCVEDDVDFSTDPPKEVDDGTSASNPLPSEPKEPDASSSAIADPATAAANDPPATATDPLPQMQHLQLMLHLQIHQAPQSRRGPLVFPLCSLWKH